MLSLSFCTLVDFSTVRCGACLVPNAVGANADRYAAVRWPNRCVTRTNIINSIINNIHSRSNNRRPVVGCPANAVVQTMAAVATTTTAEAAAAARAHSGAAKVKYRRPSCRCRKRQRCGRVDGSPICWYSLRAFSFAAGRRLWFASWASSWAEVANATTTSRTSTLPTTAPLPAADLVASVTQAATATSDDRRLPCVRPSCWSLLCCWVCSRYIAFML